MGILRRCLAVVAAASVAVGLVATPAKAVDETLAISIRQVDGTPSWDADDAPGHDSGPNNGVVRTNDTLTYNVTYTSNDGTGTDNPTFTLRLPRGVVLGQVPAYCESGSSLTPSGANVPVTMPLSATSWQSLPTQVLVCRVADSFPANATFTYPVVVKVRGEVPQGTVLETTAEATSDFVTTPVVSSAVEAKVSAKAQFDVSKNSIAAAENAGYAYGPYVRPCTFDTSRMCLWVDYPVLIAAPAGGKGGSPATSFTFYDDLSPASLFPDLNQAAWDAMTANPAKYGARLVGCLTSGHYSSPGAKIGGALTAVNSVRDSGVISCAMTAPGEPVLITVTKPDTSAVTCPKESANPSGTSAIPMPADKCYVVSGRIAIDVPVDTVTDFGVPGGTPPSTWTLRSDNRFTNFAGTTLDGTKVQFNDPADRWNDHNDITLKVETSGSMTKYFSAVPNEPYNMSGADYAPGSGYTQGPPGGATRNSGNIIVLPGQNVLSTLTFRLNTSAVQTTATSLACDAWDNTDLYLRAADYPAITLAGNRFPSNGAPVWVSGQSTIGGGTNPAAHTLQDLVIEYGTGTGGAGGASACDDASSPTGWQTDPAKVPGNDPTLAAQGIYTGVSRVRVYFKAPPLKYDQLVFFSIGLRVAPDAGDGVGEQIGDRVGNWAGVKLRMAQALSLDEIKDAKYAWSLSSYNKADHSGNLGDRLTLSEAFARINKEVWDPNTTSWVKTVPQYSGGQTVRYRLSPTLNAGVQSPLKRDVTVEDCLPASQSFVGASVVPQIAQVVGAAGPPAGSRITCPAGDTYVRWVLPNQSINAPITPIEMTARVKAGVAAGTFTNNARVQAENDQSSPALLTSSAQIQVVMPIGIYIDKQPLTPVEQVNRTDATTLAPLQWDMVLANIGLNPGVTNVDFIDRLPRGTANGSDFDGTWTFDSLTVTDGDLPGQPVQVLYTKAAALETDPRDASNSLTTGTTVWCSAAQGGTPVYPSTATAADCPTNADVTGIRVLRAGKFDAGDRIAARLSIIAVGNSNGDVYINRVQGTAEGRDVIGPVDAPERIVASTIGDYVWNDRNHDGIQNAGDVPVDGFSVRLTGTDDLGNPVSLTTTTNSDGAYLFTGLRAGTYSVTFDPASLQPGQHFTFQNVAGGTLETDSDGNVTTGQTVTYTLGAGQDMLDIDQGLQTMAPSIDIEKHINDVDADLAQDAVAVDAGSTMDITFIVKNTGDVTLTGVTVTDDTISKINCPADSLKPGASMTCTASYPAPTGKDGDYLHTNTAKVVGTPPAFPDGTQLANVHDSDSANAKVKLINLRLDKSGTATSTHPGDSVTFTLTPHNDGPAVAMAGWTVTDLLPAGLTLVSLSFDSDAYSCDNGTLICTSAVTLPAGETGAPIKVVATIDAEASGTLHNVAYVTPDAKDVDETNPLGEPPTSTTDTATSITDNDAQADVIVDRTYNLTLKKVRTSAATVQSGSQVTFELTPHNDGPTTAKAGWSVTEVLPAGLALVSMTGSGYTCSGVTCVAAAPLPGGSDGPVITVVAKVTGTGTLHNIAYVAPEASDSPETNPLGPPPGPGTDTDATPTDNDAQAMVTAPIVELPSTGSAASPLMLIAAVMMVGAGAALVWRSARSSH